MQLSGYLKHDFRGGICHWIMASGVQVHQRFIRWQRKGMWKKLFEILKGDKNFEWLMIDSSYVKAHQHATVSRGGNQAISKTKRGSIRKYT